MMLTDEWIGVAEVAAEMKYTQKQAWEYVRKIGLVVANSWTMSLVRFTRAEFAEARRRGMAPLAPRAKSGAVAASSETPRKAAAPVKSAAAKLAKLRKA
jgi:hypothetical protein